MRIQNSYETIWNPAIIQTDCKEFKTDSYDFSACKKQILHLQQANFRYSIRISAANFGPVDIVLCCCLMVQVRIHFKNKYQVEINIPILYLVKRCSGYDSSWTCRHGLAKFCQSLFKLECQPINWVSFLNR
jgi:hypothetical protein